MEAGIQTPISSSQDGDNCEAFIQHHLPESPEDFAPIVHSGDLLGYAHFICLFQLSNIPLPDHIFLGPLSK